MEKYLKQTTMMNFSHPNIQSLITKKNWNNLDQIERVKTIYNFVRDEILFGYNISDNLTASEVLKDGYGQCNTKATLLMTLLRACDIPNRIHGFTIDKKLQKGAITGIGYFLAPSDILHGWVEVFVDNQWFGLEGVILDKPYINELQKMNKDNDPAFCGYGAFTQDFNNIQIDWSLNNTYIQEQGINNDFGVFDTADEFFGSHKQKLNFVKKFLYEKVIRHLMNRNVSRIRG